MRYKKFSWLRDVTDFRAVQGFVLAFAASAFPYVVQAQGTFQQYPQPGSPTNVVPGLVNPSQPSPNPYGAGWPGNLAPGAPPAPGSGNFWSTFMNNRLNPGTVLTGTMQDSLSSKKNNVGDVFTITIDQGYSVQDKVVVPPGSKVLGSVTAVAAAKSMRNGAPGNLSVSIQSIVFPDGRSSPISAFIQFNPNQNANRDQVAGKKGKINNQIPLASYGNSLKGMGYSTVGGLTRMFGVRYSPQAHLHAGLDFSIDKGEPLAIKLNRSLDLSAMTPATAPPWGSAPTSAQIQGAGAPAMTPEGNLPFSAPINPNAASVPGGEPF